MDARYLKLTNNNHYLFKFKVNETPQRYNSQKGEVDIFISIPNSINFENVCIQTEIGKKYFENSINKVSWHGFYAEINDKINLPVIRFKNNLNEVIEIRHKGTVNQKDIFLFPICSVYIPKNINWDQLPGISEDEKLHQIEIANDRIIRIDFFVLPKIISIEKFMSDFSLSIYYFVGDITLFDKSKNGYFFILSTNDIELKSVRLNNWDVLMRFVYIETLEPQFDNTFSILFHDPNDAIEMLLNRSWAYKNTNGKICFEDIRKRHLNEIKNKLNKNT